MRLPPGPAVAALYALLGAAGLTLAIPPGYASPIFPAAGLALAAVLHLGRSALPAVWVGSFLLNIAHAWLEDRLGSPVLIASACIATGAALQAALGQVWVERRMGKGWQRLESEGQILAFLLWGGVLACLASATVATAVLWGLGVIGTPSVPFSWWTWYTGDLLGVAIFSPLVLLYLTPDRELRLERRAKIVVPVFIALGLSLVLYGGATYMERRQLYNQLSADGNTIAGQVQDRLIIHQTILSSLAHFAEAHPRFDFQQFARFTRESLTEYPDLFALSVNDAVSREALAGYEAWVSRSSPLGAFRATERGPERRLVPVGDRPEYVVVRYIVPLQGNRPAVGFDIHSEPVRRAAIERARASGKPAVTTPIRLVQEDAVRTGVLVLAPVFGLALPERGGATRSEPPGPTAYAVAVLKVDDLVHIATQGQVPRGLQLQIRDELARDPDLRFYGPERMPEVDDYRRWSTTLSIADRQWTLDLRAEDAYVNQGAHWMSWAVGAVALLFTGLLQIYLHGLSGRVLAMRRQNRALLEKQAELLLAETVFDNTADAIVVTDADGRVLSVNPMFVRITGYTLEAIQGQPLALLGPPESSQPGFPAAWDRLKAEGRWQGEMVLCRQDGQRFTSLLSIAAVTDGQHQAAQFVGSFSDITDKKAALSQIEFMAFHDALTGLPNRLLGRQRAQEAMARAQRYGYQAAVLFLDLDHFKLVNDTYGHSVGDRLLQEVARRLRASLRADDTVCRLSGDEFMLILEHIEAVQDVMASCDHVMAALEPPCLIDGRLVQTSVSVGIALSPGDGDEVEDLLRKADTAMFEAKQGGRNTYRFFDAAMNRSIVEFVETRDALAQALRLSQFELHYQPQIRLSDQAVIGAEALLRWHHPSRGLLGPGQFISIAEQSGMIVPMGAWVVQEACRQMRAWQDAGLPLQRIAVNLSGIQIRTGHIGRTVAEALSAAGLAPRHLELELTETVLISDQDKALERVRQLKALGVRLSIDDFGTGYSSMAYLKRFNLDKIKIDASFAAQVGQDAEDTAIVRSIVQMAQALGLETTAEGVEQEEALAPLRAMGCTYVQGYYYARPMPAAEFAAWVRQYSGPTAATP